MERDNFTGLDKTSLSDHYQIGSLKVEAENIWNETGVLFKSIKAREQLLTKHFFLKGFINRYVIPAQDTQSVEKTLNHVCSKEDISIGIRTAYPNPKPGITPWLMQDEYQPNDKFLNHVLKNYHDWMQDQDKPEAIIIMENPKYLGSSQAAKESFVLHISSILSESRCILEGRLGTDQTRILEETNKNYRPELNFRGQLLFKISPKSVIPLEFTWDKRFLMSANINTRIYLQNIQKHLMSEINLPNLLARLIALNIVTSHETMQFQGRKSLNRNGQSYFDFFLGYGIRGAQEKEIVQRAIIEQKIRYPAVKIYNWQKPGYE